MQVLLENSLSLLQKEQALVDTLFREGLCDSLSEVYIAQLKISHADYMELHREEFFERTNHVKEYLFLWKDCVNIYNTLYHMAYDALEKPKPFTAEPSPTSSHYVGNAPMDPLSAFNITECASQYGDVSVRLFNDNESLLRYGPSSFSQVKDAPWKSESMCLFYEKESLRIGEFLQEVQEKMSHGPLYMSDEMRETREVLMSHIQHLMAELTVIHHKEGLEKLVESLLQIEKERAEERKNLLVYLGNLVNKFNEVSRLRDNLLRSYHLTVTQKRSERVLSLF